MAQRVSRAMRNLQIAPREQMGLKALIVDRDAMSAGLLAEVLVHDLSCEAIGTRSTELLRMLGASETSIVIISADLNSRPGAGLDLARAVSTDYPDTPIVILVDHPTRAATINAFRAGARGVFSREESKGEFINCVRHVCKGSIWAGAEETGHLLDALRNFPAIGAMASGDEPALTAREMQVVRAAAKGRSNKAIAGELGLSEHTVKNYLFRVFEKLGVSSRVELLFYLTMRGHMPGSEPEVHARASGE
jgi:two-component system, NarL family, nitrate/nitrite response regulator NarL